MEHRFVATDGIKLHVVQAGPELGPPVILLHGFPEFWYGWRHQIDFLANAGYSVWVPDQRGYGSSDKPQGIAAYGIDKLASDVIGLADHIGQQQVCLAGHDWGAAVAWRVATLYPQRIRQLVILNVPHPMVLQRAVTRNPRQMMRSLYIGFFQIPRLPEWILSRGEWRVLEQVLVRSSRPGTFTGEDLARYHQAWSQPGAITAMLNWYRAAVQYPPRWGAHPRVTVPTMMLWGERDVALGKDLAQQSIDLCERGRLVFFPNASHWLQHEEPVQVNRLILDAIKSDGND